MQCCRGLFKHIDFWNSFLLHGFCKIRYYNKKNLLIFVCVKCFRFNPYRIVRRNLLYTLKIITYLLYVKNMQTIKSVLNYIDIMVGYLWGLTFMEVIPLITTGSPIIFTQFDNFIKTLISIAGLVYLVVRINHYYRNSKIDRELKAIELIHKQEELSKKDLKFLKKFYEEFLKDR